MIYFDKLIGAHEGRPAIIIGGGPSAPDQIERARERLDDPVLISVNEHGSKLLGRCDYSVSLDNIAPKLREYETPKISPYNWADIKITGHWNAANSGRTACWVAWKLGCTPIVLVGMDLYQGGTYFWNKQAHSSGRNTKFEGHLKEWQVVPHRVPGEILTCMGGPLVDHDIIQKFDGRRKYPAVPYREQKIKVNGKKPPDELKVRILRPVWIEGFQYALGEEPVVRPKHAKRLVEMKKAEYVH